MKSSTLALLGCLTLLGGCSSLADFDRPAYSAFPFSGMAPMAPPENIAEEKPVIESPGDEYWIPGYWSYDGLAYNWNPGKLVDRPDPTAIWSIARWELRGYGWTFIPGHWE